MLFQPTNITPDYRGQLGNGTVDATEPLEVSWQVNGNSAMTAFQIVIYQNDAESTQVYDTGKLTDGCPFYGTKWNGEAQYFSYTISTESAALTNGNEYKLVITQWWGNGEEDFVAQTSASAFITRDRPTLTISEIPAPLNMRKYTFTADYEQAQGDSLNWMRWQIAYADDTQNPFYDTQNIYGTAQVETTYDGFFTGNSYKVRVMIQTVNGIEADSGWVPFAVSFPTGALTGLLHVTPICNGDGAELVWDKIVYIPGTINGDVTVEDGEATIPEGASLLWNTIDGESIDFAEPWSVVWGGRTILERPEYRYSKAKNAQFITIQTDNGTILASYNNTTRKYGVTFNGTELASIDNIKQSANMTAIITKDKIYLRAGYNTWSGGLYPSQTLYPSSALFPEEDTPAEYAVRKVEVDISQSFGSIHSVQLGGVQICDYLQIIKGEPRDDVINQVYNIGMYAPSYDPDRDYMVANFANGVGGGNLDGISGDGITGLSLYRKNGNSSRLTHVADFPLSDSAIQDYSLSNQQGPYSWYLFAQGETTYIAESVESNQITPCFWDWIVLEASYDEEGGNYTLVKEYRFGKNLQSGSISNNNKPSVLENFTRYPFVQLSQLNYMSGSLTSLIGLIDHTHPTLNGYYDTLEMRDAIWKLSTTRNHLFLKNRKGDFIEIRVSGPITMETMDESKQQAQTVTIPWVQIGDADGVSILQVLTLPHV